MGLPTSIRDIGHGAQLSSEIEESGTLVGYLDKKGRFHYGFAYKNGSNIRVVCWEDDKRKDRAIPSGAQFIEFCDEVTQNRFKDEFCEDDFHFSWLDTTDQKTVGKALLNLKLGQVADKMATLKISKFSKR